MRRGFSLVEMAMVIAIAGLMLSFGLKSNEASAPDCYVISRQQMVTIRAAIETFARKNDRLPLPAARNIGVENINYGRESSGTNIDTYSTGLTAVSYGAIPFKALGLAPSYGADCWGNKFSYAVTTALTTNATTGGFLDLTVNGNITLESSTTPTVINTNTAYAIISHGEDATGAVKANAIATGHGWCTGTGTLKLLNCLANSATLADAVFNDGANVGNNYFDDIIIASGRPQMANTSNLYCWGTDWLGWGTLADGVGSSTHSILTPVRVRSNVQFTTLLDPASYRSAQTPCALTSDGTAYCWGYNPYGSMGDGTSGNIRTTPTAVNTTLKFSKIYSFTTGTITPITLALTSDGTAYFWGGNGVWSANFFIGLNTASATTFTVPTAVATTQKFTKLVSPGSVVCGLTATGDTYCWGPSWSQLGGGTYNTDYSVKLIAGSHKFSDIVSTGGSTCGLTNASDPSGLGKIFCWGGGVNGMGLPPMTITGITNANPGVVTYSGSYSLTNGDTYTIRNVTGMGEVNYQNYYVGASGTYNATSLQLSKCPYCPTGDQNTTSYGTYASGGELLLVGTNTPRQIAVGTTFTKLISSSAAIGTDGKLYQFGGNDIGYLGTGSGPTNHQGRTAGYTITSITNASPAVLTTAAAHGLSSGAIIEIVNAPGMTGTPAVANAILKVGTVLSSTSFQLLTLGGANFDTTGDSAMTSNGAADLVPTDGSDFFFNGGSISYSSFTPIPVPGFTHVTDASPGGYIYGMIDSGIFYTWGPGSAWNYPVGDSTTSARYTPVPLTLTGITPSASHFWYSATAMLIDTTGNAYEWGENIYGEAGNGTTTANLKPSIVSGGHNWTNMMSVGSGNYLNGVWCGLSTN